MLHHDDALNALRKMADNSVDSLITDPPAGISFMGKAWDSNKGGSKEWIAWMQEIMTECLRVMKPGAHGLVWAIPRTSHWTGTALELAGFEIRDFITHHFGSGFPKSLNINKALNKDGRVCMCRQEEVSGVSDLSECVRSRNQDGDQKTKDMQLQMPRCDEDEGSSDVRSLAKIREQHEGQGAQGQKVWSNESGLEGWSDLQAEQGQLHRPEICKVSERISSDVSQGRLHNGTSASNGETPQSNVNENGSGSSSRSQYSQQSDRESPTVQKQLGPQTCGSCGKTIIPEGLGTALKPSTEIWWLVRKPCSEKTVAANVLKHGTGGINIDDCRITTDEKLSSGRHITPTTVGPSGYRDVNRSEFVQNVQGRFPANLILSHTIFCTDEDCDPECAVKMLDEQSGVSKSNTRQPTGKPKYTGSDHDSNAMRSSSTMDTTLRGHSDSGGSSRFFARFFYCAKASKRERNAGLEGMPEKPGGTLAQDKWSQENFGNSGTGRNRQNHHPTVKPQKLMQYLITLITPPNGIVLDPFMGSGSTGVAAKKLGFQFIGIEKEKEYFEIAEKRIDIHTAQ